MKRNTIRSRGGTALIAVVLLLLGANGSALAKDPKCWAEFYEYAQFIGDHFRVEGPKKFPNLRNVKGENWSERIDSIVVGPKAKVTVYENINYKLTLTEMSKFPVLMRSLGITEEDIKEDSELIFGPNSMIHHLGEYNFHKKTKSLKVDCVK